MNMMTGTCSTLHPALATTARVLLALLFIILGFGKLMGIAGTAGFIAKAGLPAPVVLAWLAGIVEVVGGILLIVGPWKRWAAWALVVFTVLATLFFHLKGTLAGDQLQMTMTLKNLAIIGGLIFAGGCAICGSAIRTENASLSTAV